MTPQELEKYIIDIFKAVGEINTKAATLCNNLETANKRLDKAEQKLDNLPCDVHHKIMMEKIDSRTPFKLFLPIVLLMVSLIMGAYKYTYSIDEELQEREVVMQKIINQLDDKE